MTFSRLTLGEPRLRGKPSGGAVSSEPPCSEPLSSGEVIQQADEAYIATYGSGTNIPYITGGDSSFSTVYEQQGAAPVPASDPTIDQAGLLRGIGANAPATNYDWEVNTVSPHSGSYNLWVEQLPKDSDPTKSDSAELRVFWVEGYDCDSPLPDSPLRYAARVQEGNVVDIDFWAKHVVASGSADSGIVNVTATLREEDGSSIESHLLQSYYTSAQRLTSTAYQNWNYSFGCPALSHYLQVEFILVFSGGTTTFLDGFMDDLTITVS